MGGYLRDNIPGAGRDSVNHPVVATVSVAVWVLSDLVGFRRRTVVQGLVEILLRHLTAEALR